MLLDAGADATIRDHAGWTALHAALHADEAPEELVALLSERMSIADELSERTTDAALLVSPRGSWSVAVASLRERRGKSPVPSEDDAEVEASYEY